MLSILTTVVLFRNLGGFSFCFVQLADFFLYIYILIKLTQQGPPLLYFPQKKLFQTYSKDFILLGSVGFVN
jgi:hypothetical protein